MKHVLMAIGVAAIVATPAVAQTTSVQPHYGSITLDAGFIPDPHTVMVQAGGHQDAGRLGDGCWGYISDAPDYNLYYTAGAFPLYISANSDSDTVLVVNDPSGNWICNDDGAEGLNAGIEFSRPASGLYNIWVGRFGTQGEFIPAQLNISELGFDGGMPASVGGLDYSLEANFGSTSLNAGFVPDPVDVQVLAGGNVDVSAGGVDGCWGYASSAPDYELSYTAGSFDLYLSATSDRDTVLIVNDPNGNWICDDDSAGSLNPGIQIDNPSSGVYDIWVGTYSDQGDFPPATLHISELAFGGEFGGSGSDGSGSLDFALPANYGSTTLSGGFTPDPFTVDLYAGGDVSVSRAVSGIGNCQGYVTSAPDYELSFTAGSLDLFISAASSSDTTLVVNAPDGSWWCDDDGGEGGFNPGIEFPNPQSGVYDIWVGTYSDGDPAAARLNISELGFFDND